MSRLEQDREILRNFQSMMIPKEGFDESKYHYVWEYRGSNGIYIHQAKALGYELVRGEMPENAGMRDETGHCTMGDTVLMRVPLERYKAIQRARESLDRQARGENDTEALRAQINDRLSGVVGRQIEVSFEFKDPNELMKLKAGA